MEKRTSIVFLFCLLCVILLTSNAIAAEREGVVSVSKLGFTVEYSPTAEQIASIADGVAQIDPAKLSAFLNSVDDKTLARVVEAYPNIKNLSISNAFHGSKGHVGTTTLAPLAKLTQLVSVTVKEFPNGQDIDLSVFESSKELKEFFDQNNVNMNISPLGNIPSIERLNIIRGPDNIAWITKLTNLKFLSLGSNPLKDYTPIGKSTITQLSISHGKDINLGFLSEMPQLTNLEISYSSGLSNFAALGKLNALTHLRLDSISGPVDLSFAKNLKNLQIFYMDKTPVTNFESLAGATNLAQLYMRGTTGVTSLEPIKELEKLFRLEVTKGVFSAEDLTGFPNKRLKPVEK